MDAAWIVAIGAAVAGFVQGLSGFAFGMVSMSFWAWVLDPRLAAALAVFGALTGQLLAVFSVRRGFNWALLWPFLLGGLAGIPLGVRVLPHLDMDWFKVVLGALLALWCPVMLMAQRLPRIGGVAGSVPTLWCTLRGFNKDTQRAVIQNFNLSMLAVTMATYLATGIVTRDMAPMFAVVAPAMLIPTLLGTRLYIGISEVTFRRLVLGLLTCSGLTLLASSLPRLLAH